MAILCPLLHPAHVCCILILLLHAGSSKRSNCFRVYQFLQLLLYGAGYKDGNDSVWGQSIRAYTSKRNSARGLRDSTPGPVGGPLITHHAGRRQLATAHLMLAMDPRSAKQVYMGLPGCDRQGALECPQREFQCSEGGLVYWAF